MDGRHVRTARPPPRSPRAGPKPHTGLCYNGGLVCGYHISNNIPLVRSAALSPQPPGGPPSVRFRPPQPVQMRPAFPAVRVELVPAADLRGLGIAAGGLVVCCSSSVSLHALQHCNTCYGIASGTSRHAPRRTAAADRRSWMVSVDDFVVVMKREKLTGYWLLICRYPALVLTTELRFRTTLQPEPLVACCLLINGVIVKSGFLAGVEFSLPALQA